MPPVITLKDIARESAMFRGRVFAAAVFILVLSVALLGRLLQLQVLDYEHFRTLSNDNRVKILPLPPTRGLIFDRNGVVLAENVPTYSLEIIPEAVKDMDSVVARLRALVDISDEDLARFRALVGRKRRFESVPLLTRLSETDVARFAVRRHEFPGVDVRARLTRRYPRGELAVHLVGYVGRINEDDLQEIDTANYRGTSHIGKTGVEEAYEEVLHGRVGYQQVETNAEGRIVRVLEQTDPTPGSNLYLTIDAELQAVAERTLGDERGSIVAIDPQTGGVLAFASRPGFDPNLFVDGIGVATYKALLQSPARPLFNRALNGQYPPGSTIKPFMGLAGLDGGLEQARRKAWCPGWFQLPGKAHRYRDWKKGGHGFVDLHEAIVQSCDVYFYQLALEMGIDRMHDYLSELGFGERTGIDLSGESSGLMPSSEWKKRVRGQPWYPGETLIAGIGQGFVLATPLQLASATATLAMRGARLRPQVIQRIEDPQVRQSMGLVPEPIPSLTSHNTDNWEAIVSAMTDVVHGARGTARRIAKGATYRIAGKTGTAQVFTVGQEEEYDADTIDKRLRDHALFIAFAPVEKPRIAVAVLVENGGSGSRTAAPIAREVMDAYLLSETRPAPPANDQLLTRSASDERASDAL